jgi:hypothetical protein
MEFWSADDLDFADPLNAVIWNSSAAVQDRIQPYRSRWEIDEIGAQQAMWFPHRLPWVPDIIGLDSQEASGLLIVGSAYAPFVGNGRRYEITASEYVCETCETFGRVFFRKLILHHPYYTAVAKLASPVVPSCRSIALFDLCRVSFVQRVASGDKGGDGIVKQAPNCFIQYVESSTPNDWLWRRVVSSKASTILALGTIAEHGVLRLFARNLAEAHIVDSVDSSVVFAGRNSRTPWPLAYAHGKRQIQHRANSETPLFWRVRGQLATGEQRTWNVVVVTHPTGSRVTYPEYSARILQDVYAMSAT